MRLQIPNLGFSAWLYVVFLLLAVPLFYAIREGYVNKTVAAPLGIIVVALYLLARLVGFVRFVKTDGKKDIREFFKSARKEEMELKLAEREWAKEAKESDPRFKRLEPKVKNRIQSLEIAYIRNTCARTTLSLAKAYEECGLLDVAQLYYDQLLEDFRWSKEARAFRKAFKKIADRPIT